MYVVFDPVERLARRTVSKLDATVLVTVVVSRVSWLVHMHFQAGVITKMGHVQPLGRSGIC